MEQSIFDLVDDINEKMYCFVSMNTEHVPAAEAGLDNRCGYIDICQECIIVDKRNDRLIQYYGGFEYVDKEFRQEIGDYVIYLADDGRVQGHLDRYYSNGEAEE